MTFEYKPRTVEQWQKRIDQNPWSNRTFRPRPEPVAPIIEDPEIEDAGPEDGDDSETPKAKVSSTTPCLCGHPRKDHHTTPESHDSDNAYYCITAHCDVFSYRDGVSAPCDCQYFRVAETDAPKFTKPRVGPYDLCATCGHFKNAHCSKKKPGAVARLEPGEMAYRMMRKADGTAYGCKHFSLTDPLCQCDSTSCSATDDGKEFCRCEKFVNPWIVQKTRVRKATVASPVVSATYGTSGTVPAKPRRSRKRKTAFVTGTREMLPPEVEVNP
jgi:hypothetical protein